MFGKLVVVLVLLTSIEVESLKCHVGSNYQVPEASIDSGTLTSQTCLNDEKHCVRLEGTATVTLFGFQQNTATLFTVAYCSSVDCTQFNCSNSESNQKLSDLNNEINSQASLSAFAQTSCKLGCCKEDDCNALSVDDINKISCMVGESYALDREMLISNNLKSTSCDVSAGRQSCSNTVQDVIVDYNDTTTKGTILKGECVSIWNCENLSQIAEKRSTQLNCSKTITPPELRDANIQIINCSVNCCNMDNCNNKTLSNPAPETPTAPYIKDRTLQPATTSNSTIKGTKYKYHHYYRVIVYVFSGCGAVSIILIFVYFFK